MLRPKLHPGAGHALLWMLYVEELMQYGAPLQLTTGRPPHRCNVAMLGRSRHSEGCGWRCPTCGAEYTLTRVLEPVAGGRLYPTMQWIRDEAS